LPCHIIVVSLQNQISYKKVALSMNKTLAESTYNKVVKRIRGRGRGSLVFQSDFADCGTPSAVKSAFHRMLTETILIRMSQGIYLYPKTDEELGLGILYPSIEEVAATIGKRDKAKMIPTGVYAMNRLGLSTQVPMNVVFITSGTQRRVKIGNGRGIVFKHSSSGKNFEYRSELMLLIVAAMREIGKDCMSEAELAKLLEFREKVSTADFKHDIKLVPAWIRTILMKK